MTTLRTIKVTADWLDNSTDPDVFGPTEVFTAQVEVDEAGKANRWNGWLSSPLFTYDEAARLAAWLDKAHAEIEASLAASNPHDQMNGLDRLVVSTDSDGWQSVTIIPGDPEAWDGLDTHVSPSPASGTGEALYEMGFGWTWVEAHEGCCWAVEDGQGCEYCDQYEDEVATTAGHPEACSYTLKATVAERLDHYRTRTPTGYGYCPFS